MRTCAAIVFLSCILSGITPAAMTAPHQHTKVKASKRKPYKVKGTKVHQTKMHRAGH